MTINPEPCDVSAKKPRITWIDYAKGIGIILVVLGHTLRGLRSSGILTEEAGFRFVDAWIYSFHMPLFFLLSGLFANRKINHGAVSFIRDKFATLAYPYLVWSTLQTLMQAATSGHTNHKTSVYDLAGILTNPIMQFWFLYALLLITIIFYGLRRFGFGPLGALMIFTALWAIQTQVSLTDWMPLRAAINNGLYYALGATVNQNRGSERLSLLSPYVLTMVAVLGFGAVTLRTTFAQETTIWMAPAVAVSGIAASLAIAVLLSRIDTLHCIRVLGIYSLEIYVAHTIASAGARIVFQKFLHINDSTIHIVLGCTVGLIAPMILASLCRRFRTEFLFRLPQ